MRQFKAEGLRDDLLAGTPDTFSSSTSWSKLRIARISDYSLSTSVVHPCTPRFWRLKAAVNETRKASKHWQEFSCDKLVTNMLSQQSDINPCICKRFCLHLELEQHGDDFLVCGRTSNLEVLEDELKNDFLVKKAEIVSPKPEHQNEIHFLRRRISVENFEWHVELDQRYVKSLLDAMAMDHCKSMATPGSKGQESSRNVVDVTEKLDPQEHREFRSGAGICQYMTEQRFDIALSTKEVMREAAGPTTTSKTKLKRIARYLKGRQRCVLDFPWVGKLDDVIHVLETQRQGTPRSEE